MNHGPFFPDLFFGWTFYVVLVGICCVAAVVDFINMTIPKWLTLSLLGLGIVFNVARGVWMGAEGQKTWILPSDSWLLGGLDGLLFAIVGFLIAFTVFFILWALQICGGGDVKLFAAVGAWIGGYIALWIMVGSVFIVGIMYILRIVIGSVVHGPTKTMKEIQKVKKHRTGEKQPKKGSMSRLMTYSFPIAVATAVVLLWFFSADLHLTAEPIEPGPVSQNVSP